MAIRILLSKKLGELRWTQADLARKTNIRPATINELYHELCERVNLDHLDLICEALGCELSEILVWEPGVIKRTRSRSGKRGEGEL
ncbi:MAG: helix-turn-helix transcriptional regulator [Oscillospiraceae bacterium]|nr:helix-turn-helix transcriptional regulator [Oscillospiraceae bacterium]